MAGGNTSKIVLITAAALAFIGGVGYAIWYFVKGAGSLTATAASAAAVKAANTTAINDAKAAAVAKAAAQADPSPANLATLQSALTKAANSASAAKVASSSKGGGASSGGGGSSSGGGKNSDGSTPKDAVDQFGNAIGTTVDAQGNYIEKGDPTTLYNAHGDVIGDLDPNTGMFVDSNGKAIAACDGSPVSSYDPVTGNYTETGGDTYSPQGVAIILDPTTNNYIEKDDPTTLYNNSGDVIGNLDTTTGNFNDPSTGNPIATADGTAIVGYDDQTGQYQDPSGQWYNSAGDPIPASDVNQDNITYNTPDGNAPATDPNPPSGGEQPPPAAETPPVNLDPYADINNDIGTGATGSITKKPLNQLNKFYGLSNNFKSLRK